MRLLANPLRAFALLLVLMCIGVSIAQAQLNYHHDLRKANLGLHLGINFSDIKIKYTGIMGLNARPGQLVDFDVTSNPGFNIGMITNLRLHRYFDLRFIPTVSLQQRNFRFQYYGDSIVDKKLEASYLDLPLMVKYKSQIYNNYRVYVMTGVKYSFNMVSDRKVMDDPDLIKIDRTDLSLEAAFGIDLYGDRVKLAPEIRYSLGLRNIFVDNFTEYKDIIRIITSQSLTLSINFE